VFDASGSGFDISTASWSAALTGFDVEQNNVSTLDVTLSPGFKAATLGSGFANYFTNGRYIFIGNDGNDTFKSVMVPIGCSAATATTISMGISRDRVIGGAGDDALNGGRGNDIVIGGLGTDRCRAASNGQIRVQRHCETVVGAGRDVIILPSIQRTELTFPESIRHNRTADQLFNYIGGANFSSVPASFASPTAAEGDVDGNGSSGFRDRDSPA
jgi:Ca2+-binding RTX toxin-like protein